MDALTIAYKVMKEINGVKYLYDNQIDGAIKTVCQKFNLTLDDSMRIDVKDKVCKALSLTQ